MALTNLFGAVSTEAKQDSILTKLTNIYDIFASIILPGTAKTNDPSLNIQSKESETWAWSFAKVLATSIDTEKGTIIKQGAGMTIRQQGGNLEILSGTTAYSESTIRSNVAFDGRFRFEYALMLSQRIANHNVSIELTDIIGDNLPMTVNSATSVTVTATAHGLSATDIGKGIWINNMTVASCLTQRAVIASIPTVDTITLTVVGFPASGSGTCSLFGMNYHQVIYNGTTATSIGTGYTTQRLGWQNTFVNATINTTASPGHIGIIDATKPFDSSYIDQVPGTSTSVQISPRATMNQNTPPDNVPLYIQIRVWNASTAPASTTTATLGFVRIELANPLQVSLATIQPTGAKNNLPVQVLNTVTATVSTTTNVPNTAQGSSTNAVYISAATTNATSVKATTGVVNHITATNNFTSWRYLKLYNKASAPTVGTDTPVHTIGLPPGSSIVVPCGAFGMRFATGIAFALTTGIANTDTVAIGASEVSVNISYT